MLKPLIKLEQGFYRLRELIWNYPEALIDASYRGRRFYALTRPFSHFVAAILLVFGLIYILFPNSFFPFLFASSGTFVEGVIVGQTQTGQLQQLSRVNPLLPTSIQLEKDLNELIYEPLIRYGQNGRITPVLAESIVRVQEGAEYEFILRNDVYWHDGRKFGVADVERSLEIISQLDERFDDSSYVRAVKQMAWERTGEMSIRICTTTRDLLARLPAGDKERKCSAVEGEKPILANFLELVSIRVIPAHLSADINALTIDTPRPALNRAPVGTGSFKFSGTDIGSIFLVRNDDYYGETPRVGRIEFKLYPNIEAAVAALQKSEIHALAVSSTDFLQNMSGFEHVNIHTSSVLANQYWAIYFNLRKDLNGNALGPDFFQDVNVRRGISAAIDRERILRTLLGTAVEAYGPIYTGNEFFNSKVKWYRYNKAEANRLLDRAGWKFNSLSGWREKSGKRLSFSMSYINTFDRDKVVESVRQDLKAVGVEMVPDPRGIEELTEQVVTTKLFDTLLYGVITFIDPDRYELFHSGEALNLSSYIGSEMTVQIKDKKTIRVPRIDKLLEQGRSFDPLEAERQRKNTYSMMQQLIAADAPAVFLYHPQFIYYVNNRIRNVNLSESKSLEERFRLVDGWEMR